MNLLNLSVKVGLKDEASDKIEGISASTIAKASAMGQAMYDAAKMVGTQALNMVSSFTQGVISGYGQFEQMQGGIEKLFGDASDTVINNSKKAFREAGMSQTEYLENSTKLAASLINSLGGDMEAAAERNAVAMKAIADNADTFGSSVEDVSNVYSALSRGMFTTLDNLRLGYAGTKEGMQSLIDDANTYAESIGETSGMTIDSFADIVRAIDLIQQKQGIAGTTMNEALTTIEGSIRMAKNSWQDFMTAVGSGDTDRIGETMQGIRMAIFGTWDEDQDQMVGGVIRNILPVFQNAISAVAEEIPALASSLAFSLGEMIANAIGMDTTGIESAQELGRRLVESIVQGASEATGIDFSSVLSTLTETIDIDSITTAFSGIQTAISEFFGGFASGLDLSGANDAISGFGDVVGNVWGFVEQSVLPHAGELGEAFGGFGSALMDIGGAVSGVFEGITSTLDLGNVTVAVESFGNIVSNVWGFVEQNVLPHAEEIGEVIGTVGNALMEAGNSILNVLETISPYLPVILGALAGIKALEIVGMVMGIASAIGGFVSAAVTAVGMVQSLAGVAAVIGTVLSGGILPIIFAVIGGIVAFIASNEEAREKIGNAIQAIGQFFSDLWASAGEAFNNIVESIKQTAADSVAQWEQMKADVAAKWQEIQESIAQALIGIVNWVLQKWAQVKQSTSDAWNAVLSTLSSIGSSIISTVQNAWNLVVTTVATALTNTYNRVLNGWGVIFSFVASIPSKITSALGNLGSLLWNAGSNLMSGLLDGIKAGWETIKSKVSGMADWIKEHKGPKAYDLALLVPNGEWIMRGLLRGIENGYGKVQDFVNGISDSISSNIGVSMPAGFSNPMATMPYAGAAGGDSYTVYLNVEDRNDFNGMALAFVDAVQSVKRNNGRASSMNVRMV